MEPGLVLLLAAAVLLASLLSGVFGMAGGLFLMAVLLFVLPPVPALILHGVAQAASNGWRWLLNRRHAGGQGWRILFYYGLGTGAVAALFYAFRFTPDAPLIFLLLGLVGIAGAALPARSSLDATRPGTAVLCGFGVNALHLTAGVSGPLLHIFFLNPALGRHQVVAIKAATQTAGHAVKVAYFSIVAGWSPALSAHPAWLYALIVLLALGGAAGGKQILGRLSEEQFRRASRWLIFVMGLICIAQAANLRL